MTIAAAMIRRPEIFFQEETPKKLQRFFIVETETYRESFSEKIDSDDVEIDIETAPLLGSVKSKRPSLDKFKNVVKKFLNPKKILESEDVRRPSLESQYTWWTKFYNSLKDPEYCNESIHKLMVSILYF